MHAVLLKRLTEDKDVVEAAGAELIEVVMQRGIDISLERARGVTLAKGHNEVLVLAIARVEGRLSFIALFDADVVKRGNDIELGKVLGLSQLVQRFADERNRVPVLHGNGIQATVVNTEA